MARKKLNEFASSDGQSTTADPVTTGSSARSADKSEGEVAIPEFKTKVEALSAVMQAMSGMPTSAIGDVFKGLSDSLNAAKNKRSADNTAGETGQIVLSPTSATGVAKEDMDLIFQGEELSEETRTKAATIFEAAVNARLVVEVARIEEENDVLLEETLAEKVEQLSESVDKYLTYVVEHWLEENELAIENGLRHEVMEDFLSGLKTLFVENYVDVPEDKVDLVAELSQRVQELDETLNSVVTENIELKDYVDSLEVDSVFSEAVSALPLTQQEKLRSLVEGIEYENVDDFTTKLKTITESFLGGKPKTDAVSLTEAIVGEDNDESTSEQPARGQMAVYMDAISKTTKK